MYTKEDFNKVWKDSSKKNILNQFYYDHMEIEKFKNIINELEKYINKRIDYETTPFEAETYYLDVLDKLKELRNENAK